VFVSVHEPGQAPDTAAMRRCGAEQHAQVQNLLFGMHISPREKAGGPARASFRINFENSNGGKRATGK